MKQYKDLLNDIINIVDDENLPDWEENVHPEILKAIERNGFKPLEHLVPEVTCWYFNALKITQHNFYTFCYDYLILPNQENEKSKELDQEKYE
jgi:hypothetical protein